MALKTEQHLEMISMLSRMIGPERSKDAFLRLLSYETSFMNKPPGWQPWKFIGGDPICHHNPTGIIGSIGSMEQTEMFESLHERLQTPKSDMQKAPPMLSWVFEALWISAKIDALIANKTVNFFHKWSPLGKILN